MINEDRESLSLSPECFSLRKTYNRPVSLINSSAPLKKRYLLQRLGVRRSSPLENLEQSNSLISESSIEKCIKVNSIISTEASKKKFNTKKSLRIYQKLHFSFTDKTKEPLKLFPDIILSNKAKFKVDYYRIKHNVIPHTKSIPKQRYVTPTLSIKGLQFLKEKIANKNLKIMNNLL